MKASDLKNKPPHILIYAPAGTGKTALISQANRGYMIDTDNGMLTARNIKDTFTSLRTGPKGIEFDTFEDERIQVPHAWRDIKSAIFKISAQIRANMWKHPTEKYTYNAFCLDSITKMAMACQNQIMGQSGDVFTSPQIQHYGLIVSEIRNILQLITTLPCLVLVTAHELPIVVGGETFIRPKVVGQKLPNEIVALFDEVWYMHVKKNPKGCRYIVSWTPTTYRVARTRSGELKEVDITDIGLKGLLKEIGYEYEE